LGDEPRRLPRPRHEQVPSRTGEPDVEQPPLLVDVRTAVRQLVLLEPGQVDRLELEALCTMERHEMDAAAGARAEPLAQRVDELRHLAVELLREPHETGEVGLARLLALAELLGRILEPALRDRDAAYGVGRRHGAGR